MDLSDALIQAMTKDLAVAGVAQWLLPCKQR